MPAAAAAGPDLSGRRLHGEPFGCSASGDPHLFMHPSENHCRAGTVEGGGWRPGLLAGSAATQVQACGPGEVVHPDALATGLWGPQKMGEGATQLRHSGGRLSQSILRS